MPNIVGHLMSNTRFASRNEGDPIPAGQTNAALTASAATVVSELVLLLAPELFDRVLGAGASPSVRAALALGILAAGALVAAVDIAARAYAAAHQPQTRPPAAPAPISAERLTVTHVVGGRDTSGWQVQNFLADHAVIAKEGETPRCVPLRDLVVEPRLAASA